ncbi:unnamed protein product [Gadus morhua 'NCC']
MPRDKQIAAAAVQDGNGPCVVPVSLRVVSSPLHASDRWFTVFAVERHMVAINMPPLVKHVAQFQQEGVHRRDPEGGLILTCCAPRAAGP